MGIPKRWEMSMLLLSGIFVVYTLRVNMSVAAQKMRDDLDWSESEKGFVLSAFYWGYAMGQIPASRFSQAYGAKLLFGLSVLIPSVLTLLVPVACRHSFGMALVIRVCIGFFESASFPAVFHFFPIWIALSEKTFMIPFICSGMYLGEIVGFSLSGVLAASDVMINGQQWGDWPSVFYVFGLLGLLWFPFWMWLAQESPAIHPYITKEEILFINRGKDLPYDGFNRVDSDEGETPNARSDVENDTSIYSSTNGDAALQPLIASAAAPDYAVAEFASGVVPSPRTTSRTASDSKSHRNSMGEAVASPLTASRTVSAQPIGGRSASLTKDEWQVFPDDLYQSQKYTKEELKERTPWKAFFTNKVSLSLFCVSFCYGWIGFTLLSEMPSYLTDILGFDLQSAGILCVFPYFALFVATLFFARFFDWLQREKNWETTSIRRAAMTICLMGSAGGLLLCGFLDNKYAAYTFMIITQIAFAAGQVGLGCSWTDVAPLYSSSMNSIGNTVGAIAGIVGPLVVAAFTDTWEGVTGWRVAFLLTLGICVFTLALWFRFIKAEIEPALNTPAALKTDAL